MMVRSVFNSRAIFCFALVWTGGCSHSAAPFLVPGAGSAPQSKSEATVTVKLSIAADVRRIKGMAPQYISSRTRSLKISEDGKTLGKVNVKPNGDGCTSDNGTTCVFTVQATTGKNRVFTIAAYDKKNASGKLLSSAKVARTITVGTNVIAITLRGKVSSLSIALENANPPAGTPANLPLIIMAKDPDGNTIVGPGKYSAPVHLTDADTTGATSLSAKTVTGPDQNVTLNYTGASLTRTTISANAHGARGTVSFAPMPTVLESFNLPTVVGSNTGLSLGSYAIAIGSDKNVWLGAFDDNAKVGAILTMTPSGTFHTFVPGTSPSTNLPNDEFSGFALASDGNIWYLGEPFSSGNGDVGNITVAGVATNFPFAGIGGACPGMFVSAGQSRIINAADGGLWFTVMCSTGSALVHATTGGIFKVNLLPSNFQQADGLVIARDGKVYVAGYDNTAQEPAIVQAAVSGDTVSTTNLVDVADTITSQYLYGIVQTADGDLWAMNNDFNATAALVRLHLAGGFSASSITEFQTLATGEEPAFPIALADGSMWIPESNVEKVTQLIPNGENAPFQFDLSVPGNPAIYPCMWDVVLASDRNLYFNNYCRKNGAMYSSNVIKLAY